MYLYTNTCICKCILLYMVVYRQMCRKKLNGCFYFACSAIGAWCMVDCISICIWLYIVDCVERSESVVCLLCNWYMVHGAWLTRSKKVSSGAFTRRTGHGDRARASIGENGNREWHHNTYFDFVFVFVIDIVFVFLLVFDFVFVSGERRKECRKECHHEWQLTFSIHHRNA